MKNISRRVFIKGLAVAGVAAAASTVLAGCNTNMIPGVDDGAEDDTTEETPAKNQVVEYTDNKGKKLTITATGCSIIKVNDQAILSFDINNGTSTKLTFDAAANASGGEYFVDPDSVEIYFDGDKKKVANGDAFGDADIVNNMFNGTTAPDVAGGEEDTLCIYANLVTDWKKMTVAFDVMKEDTAKGDYLVRKAEFTFENK